MAKARSITIDVASIAAVAHACTGCATVRACCCSSYEVCVTAREMEAIIGAMPIAAEFCPTLESRDGFANVFDETEGGVFCIDTDENGLCVFAYRSARGVSCSLHSAALRLGTPPSSVKPSSCVLWPLSLSEPPGRWLSICDDALTFDCCKPRKGKRTRTVSASFIESVGEVFGTDARAKLTTAADKGLGRTRITPRFAFVRL